MKTNYPVITDGNFHTQDGKFFRLADDCWRQIEVYLPSATGTYGEPIEATARKLLERLNAGTMKAKSAIGSTGSTLSSRYHQDGVRLVLTRAQDSIF